MSYTATTTYVASTRQRYTRARQRLETPLTADATGAMDKVRVQDGDDRSSDSVDLSALNDNETDDFGRKLLAAQREKRALNQNDGTRQLFPRARPRPVRPKTTDPVLTLEGTTTITTETRSAHQRIASEGDNRLTPALNVPQEWGRRAKKREWQRRSVSDEYRIVRQDKDSIWPHQTLYTGDEHPVLSPGGVGVLPSVEDTPPLMTRKRIMSSPNSMRHMNTTIQTTHSDGEDLDFNDASMLVSTPAAVNRRDRKIDELMKGETKDTGKHGDSRRRMSEVLDRPGSAPSLDLASRVARRRERRLSDKENVPNAVEEGSNTAKEPALGRDQRQSHSHSRNDSIALLRKLARVSSLSPSPGQDKKVADEAVKPNAAPLSNVAEALRSTADRSTTTRNAVSRTEARRVRIHDEKARREEVAEIEAKPAPQDGEQPHKTSVVTGASIDTADELQQAAEDTQPARGLALKSSSASSRDPRRVLSEPSHPKSALEAVVSGARATRDPQLGESTIASLENIVHPDLERTSSNTAEDVTRDVPADAENLKHLTQTEKDRRQEALALEALNKRLRNTRTTIKDASRGIRRIENQIENATGQQVKNEEADANDEQIREIHHVKGEQAPHWPRHLKPYTQPHDFRTICEHCGGSFTSVYSALWTETREFFFTYTGPNHDRPRPTPVGWAVLSFILWYWIESSLSDPWGYSRIAEVHFPFALPALLLKPFRWAGWIEYPVGRWIEELLEPVLHTIFGVSTPPVMSIPTSAGAGAAGGRLAESSVTGTPYSEWVKATATAVTGATTKVVGGFGEALDHAGRMWDDEFLDL